MIIDWYTKGFIEVIPVAPPNAAIAEGATLKPANLGKAPGKPTPHGWTGLPDWLNHRMSPTLCRIYDEAQCSVGLRSGYYPGIDIDVLDEDLSNQIAGIAREVFGRGFKRVGRHPKQLLMYAAEEKINKQVLSFVFGDIQQKVEILGVGSQYVVEGIHPVTRKPYVIEDFDELTPTSLTVINQDQIRKFLEKVIERLDLVGAEIGTMYSASGRREGKPKELLTAKNKEHLAEALDELPNDYDWEEWRDAAAAIKAATQDDETLGLELWMKFSAKAKHVPFNQEEAQGIWDRMKPPYSLGADWIYSEASRLGNFNYAKTIPHLLNPPPAPTTVEENKWFPGSASWVAEEFKLSALNRLRVVLEWKLCIIRHKQNWEVDHKNVRTATAIKKFLVNDIFPRLSQEMDNPTETLKKLSSVREQKAILEAITDSSYDLTVRADELDRNPNILNTPDGKICLQSKEYIKETLDDVSDICLRVTQVVPDFSMKTPTWDKFLEDITGRYEKTDIGHKVYPDPEMKKYLQVYAGYAATGHTSEHIFFLLHGEGGNGKSTFVKTLQDVLGDYADVVPGDMFCVTRDKSMSYYKSKFHGRRLIVSSELGQQAVWDLGELKRLTGGDTLDARYLYNDPFKFQPTHTVLIATNIKPKIQHIDEAVKRRTRLIPFDFRLPAKKKDPHLQKKLAKEYPGILAWVIEGAVQWYQEGFPKTPLRVQQATDEYFGDNDLVGCWLTDCAVLDEDARAECEPVFKSWQLFLSQSNEQATTQTQFVELLKTHGIFKKKIQGKRYYVGMRLKNSEGLNTMPSG